MAVKTAKVPGIGTLVLSKRRGTKNIRLSIGPNNRVRVGLPYWMPYSAGILFAQSKKDWILSHKPLATIVLRDNMPVGKSSRLRFYYDPNTDVKTRIKNNLIQISTNRDFDEAKVQALAIKACERALKKEAAILLPQRLNYLAAKNGYTYANLRIKKLLSRWGSCSNHRTISLSYYLMQLPWELIDYVLAHELVHTVYLNHSKDFWQALEKMMPDARARQKAIRRINPGLYATTLD